MFEKVKLARVTKKVNIAQVTKKVKLADLIKETSLILSHLIARVISVYLILSRLD